MIRLLFVLFIISIVSSCDQEETISFRTDENGVFVELPFLWSSSLSDGELIGGGIQPSLTWNNSVLFGGMENKRQVLF